MQTYIAGIQSMDGLSFSANYDMTEYQKLKALEGKKESYAVWFGGTESAGVVLPMAPTASSPLTVSCLSIPLAAA